jgi:3-oxoacyl-[acyl-carrier-protein] synthase II
MLVVESATAAAARGAEPLAELAGIGLSGDAFHIVSPDPQGRGATRAMEAALEDAGAERGEIGYLSAHGTGTPANDRAEVAAARAVFGRNGPPMSSIKAITGHGLGAASALEAVACVQALQKQIAPPTWNFTRPDADCDWDAIPNEPRELELGAVLSNAYAFGGANASLVLRAAS